MELAPDLDERHLAPRGPTALLDAPLDPLADERATAPMIDAMRTRPPGDFLGAARLIVWTSWLKGTLYCARGDRTDGLRAINVARTNGGGDDPWLARACP